MVQSSSSAPAYTSSSPASTPSSAGPGQPLREGSNTPSASQKPPTSRSKRGGFGASPGQESPVKKHKVVPSASTREDFELCNPLLKIAARSIEENRADKFCSGQMDVEAVKACWGPGRAIKRTLEVFTMTSGKELKYRAALCQLFPAFLTLAKNSMRIVDLKEDKCEQSEKQETSITVSQESSQTPYLHHAIHEYGDVLEGSQSVDFLVQSIPKKIIQQLLDDAAYWEDMHDVNIDDIVTTAQDDMRNWKSVALIDGKDCTLAQLWTTKYAFQVGLYGAQIVKDSLDKGFVRPFYALCVSDADWRLGIIDPFGVVMVKDNTVTPESFQEFKRQEAIRFAWYRKKGAPKEVVKTPISYETLKKMLVKSRELFTRNDYSGIPDGKHIVGLYYIDYEEYSWDGRLSSLKSPNPLSPGTLKMMEGLLRVFVGDKVLKWTKEHVCSSLREMEKKEEEWCAVKEK